MSVLSAYIRKLRSHRDISDLTLAEQLGVDLNEYLRLEVNPELAPLSELYKIFKVLHVTDEEYLEFSQLIPTSVKLKKESDSGDPY